MRAADRKAHDQARRRLDALAQRIVELRALGVRARGFRAYDPGAYRDFRAVSDGFLRQAQDYQILSALLEETFEALPPREEEGAVSRRRMERDYRRLQGVMQREILVVIGLLMRVWTDRVAKGAPMPLGMGRVFSAAAAVCAEAQRQLLVWAPEEREAHAVALEVEASVRRLVEASVPLPDFAASA